MARVTVNFGGDSVSREFNNTQEILNSSALADVMGFDPKRVEISVNGAVYSGSLSNGDTVTLTTKANTKG